MNNIFSDLEKLKREIWHLRESIRALSSVNLTSLQAKVNEHDSQFQQLSTALDSQNQLLQSTSNLVNSHETTIENLNEDYQTF